MMTNTSNMNINPITHKTTKERSEVANALRVVYKKQLKSNPDLREVVELYERGAIKLVKTTREILEKQQAMAKDPSKQSDYLAKALKKPRERTQNPARRAAAAKIQKMVRNTVAFKVVDKQKALKDNVIAVTLRPANIGGRFTGDVRSLFAKAFLQARRSLPKGATFRVRASAYYDGVNAEGDLVRHAINTGNHSSKNLNEFLEDFAARVRSQYELQVNKSFHIDFSFVLVPQGAGGDGTTSRDEASILNKRSVVQIKNDDKNCSWYALNCLLHPKNKALKDERLKLRREWGKELCERVGFPWDQPVALDTIGAVEEALKVSIYVLDLHAIPILQSSVSLFDSLIFKSGSDYPDKHFLVLGQAKEHYDAITDIKKLLAARKFCFRCLTSFANVDAFERHGCSAHKEVAPPDELPCCSTPR